MISLSSLSLNQQLQDFEMKYLRNCHSVVRTVYNITHVHKFSREFSTNLINISQDSSQGTRTSKIIDECLDVRKSLQDLNDVSLHITFLIEINFQFVSYAV